MKTTATEVQNQHISIPYESVSMPIAVSATAMVATGIFLFKLSWKISKEQERISDNAKAIAVLQSEIDKWESQQEKAKREMERYVTGEVLKSETIISSSFELTATRIQASIEALQKDVSTIKDHFTQTIGRIYAQTDINAQSLMQVENALQKYGVDFHLRRNHTPPD